MKGKQLGMLMTFIFCLFASICMYSTVVSAQELDPTIDGEDIAVVQEQEMDVDVQSESSEAILTTTESSNEVDITTVATVSGGKVYMDSDLKNEVTSDTVVTDQTELYSSISIKFNADSQPTSSTTIYTYQVPSDIVIFTRDIHGEFKDLFDENGKTAGRFLVSTSNKIEFNFFDEWLQTHRSNIEASLNFSFKLWSEVTESQDYATISLVDGSTAIVRTESSQATLNKSHDISNYNQNGGYILYTIQVDSLNKDIKSLTLNDQMDAWSYAFIDENSFELKDEKGSIIDRSKYTIVKETKYQSDSFTFELNPNVKLPKGVYTLSYKVFLDEGHHLKNKGGLWNNLNNSVTGTLNGVALKKVTDTTAIKSNSIQKVKETEVSAFNETLIPWVIELNQGSVQFLLDNGYYCDEILGDQTYVNFLDSTYGLKIYMDGVDVTYAYLPYLTYDANSFKIVWPTGTGRTKVKLVYYTKLGPKASERGYSNSAEFNMNGQWKAEAYVAQGLIGQGVSKGIDITNITAQQLAAGGMGEYGQADWQLVIYAGTYSDFSKLVIEDQLGQGHDVIWFKNSATNQWGNTQADDPVIYYLDTNGKPVYLEKGKHYTVRFGIYSGSSRSKMEISFAILASEDPTLDLSNKDVYIKYSTQSTGQVGTYTNAAEFSYDGRSKYVDSGYSVYRSDSIDKIGQVQSTTSDQVTVQWNVYINSYTQDDPNNANGGRRYPNQPWSDGVMVITDTLPTANSYITNGEIKLSVRTRYSFSDKADEENTIFGSSNTYIIKEFVVKEGTSGDVYYTVNGNVVTIYIDRNAWADIVGKGHETDIESNKYLLALSYLTTSPMDNKYYDLALTNTISATLNGQTMGSTSYTVVATNDYIVKEGAEAVRNGNQIDYTILINKDAGMINSGNPFSVWDQVDARTRLLLDTIKVYEVTYDQNGNKVLTEIQDVNVVDESVMTDSGLPTKKFTIYGLLDKTAYELKYTVEILANVGDVVLVSNEAGLVGEITKRVAVSSNYRVERAEGSAQGASGLLTLFKEDGDDKTPLSGATFALYKINMTTGEVTFIVKKTTDENGQIIFGNGTEGVLELNQLYYFTETQAPEGYALENGQYYFMLEGLDKGVYLSQFQRAVLFLDGFEPEYETELLVYNYKIHEGTITPDSEKPEVKGVKKEKEEEIVPQEVKIEIPVQESKPIIVEEVKEIQTQEAPIKEAEPVVTKAVQTSMTSGILLWVIGMLVSWLGLWICRKQSFEM